MTAILDNYKARGAISTLSGRFYNSPRDECCMVDVSYTHLNMIFTVLSNLVPTVFDLIN